MFKIDWNRKVHVLQCAYNSLLIFSLCQLHNSIYIATDFVNIYETNHALGRQLLSNVCANTNSQEYPISKVYTRYLILVSDL